MKKHNINHSITSVSKLFSLEYIGGEISGFYNLFQVGESYRMKVTKKANGKVRCKNRGGHDSGHDIGIVYNRVEEFHREWNILSRRMLIEKTGFYV